MSNQLSPGPYEAQLRQANHGETFVIVDSDLCYVAETNPAFVNGKDVQGNNAKLLAASFNMLKALENIFLQAHDDDTTEQELRDMIDFMRDCAQSALNKYNNGK